MTISAIQECAGKWRMVPALANLGVMIAGLVLNLLRRGGAAETALFGAGASSSVFLLKLSSDFSSLKTQSELIKKYREMSGQYKTHLSSLVDSLGFLQGENSKFAETNVKFGENVEDLAEMEEALKKTAEELQRLTPQVEELKELKTSLSTFFTEEKQDLRGLVDPLKGLVCTLSENELIEKLHQALNCKEQLSLLTQLFEQNKETSQALGQHLTQVKELEKQVVELEKVRDGLVEVMEKSKHELGSFHVENETFKELLKQLKQVK